MSSTHAIAEFDMHVEVIGSGAPLLLIAPAGGDARYFERLAEQLADARAVVLYDRRGNSRSGHPVSWLSTSLAEQADDAARVLDELGIERAAVMGTSAGGSIALELARRHPGMVGTLILHEPSLLHALPDGAALYGQLRQRLADDGAQHGAERAFEGFLEFAFGSDTWAAMRREEVARRVLENSNVFLDIEFEPLSNGDPPNVGEVRAPAFVLCGRDSPPFVAPLCAAVAKSLNAPVVTTPGGHGAYFDHADAFAAVLQTMTKETRW
jgi:pimeloyl-ACP methyl ester carboxylesterase